MEPELSFGMMQMLLLQILLIICSWRMLYHLEDTLRYSKEFYADKLSLIAADIRLPDRLQNSLYRMQKFFGTGTGKTSDSAERTNQFVEKAQEMDLYSSEEYIIYLIAMCVLTKARNVTVDDLIYSVLAFGDIGEQEIIGKFHEMDLEPVFWEICQSRFEYIDEEPSLQKFAMCLFATYVCKDFRSAIPKKWKKKAFTDRRFIIDMERMEEEGVYAVNLGEALGTNDSRMIMLAKGMSVFKTGGGMHYVHGGSSAQEMILPNIFVKTRKGVVSTELAKIMLVSNINKISNLLVILDFLQEEPVSDIIKSSTYRLCFAGDDGELISNEIIYKADSSADDPSITHFNYAPFCWPKFPIAHGKNPQRNPLRLRFLPCTLENLFSAKGLRN